MLGHLAAFHIVLISFLGDNSRPFTLLKEDPRMNLNLRPHKFFVKKNFLQSAVQTVVLAGMKE